MPREDITLKSSERLALSKIETMAEECSDAPRAGADLLAARERLGWALPDVAAMLRIRTSYLEALEAGRLNKLPGTVYALGYLRSYATALGLDVDEVARRFRAEAGEIHRPSELIFPTPVPERGLPAGALILLGLILVGGAYVGWYHLSGENKLPAEAVSPVPAHLASLDEQPATPPDAKVASAALLPPSAARSEDSGTFEPRHAASENPLLAPDPPQPAPAPIEETRASIPGGTATTAIAMPVMQPVRQPDPAPPLSANPRNPADPDIPDGARVLLRFTGDTWIQVRERGGQTLLTRVMKAGETFPVPTRANLVLNTGNAGRVDILVDGTLVPSIGGQGAVRKDVPLDPDQLKSGPVVPTPAKR